MTTKPENLKWLESRVSHESLNKKQKGLIKAIAESQIEYTPTRAACQQDIYDTAYLTLFSSDDNIQVPVQHTRLRRKIGEPKYKSTEFWDAPTYFIPDICREGDVLIITEGFSKAVACALYGYPSLALPGVSMFKNRIKDWVLSKTWKTIKVVFDTSDEENTEVSTARTKIVSELLSLGVNATETIWNYKNCKGLDDVLKLHGLVALGKILNQGTTEYKIVRERKYTTVFSIAEEIIEDLDPWIVDGKYLCKAHDKALNKTDLLSITSMASRAYVYEDPKKGITNHISPTLVNAFKTAISDQLINCPEYCEVEDRIYFEEDEIEHYMTKSTYNLDYKPEVEDIVLDYLQNSLENINTFRALCRRLLVPVGSLEKDSLAVWSIVGKSNTGKSTLLNLLRGLVGKQSTKFMLKELINSTSAGHLKWTRLMFDDDLGGNHVKNDAALMLLQVVGGSFSLRRLYSAAQEYTFRGSVVLNTTVEIKGDRQNGLARRLKNIRTKRNDNYHAFDALGAENIIPFLATWALDMTDKEYAQQLDTTDASFQQTSRVRSFLDQTLTFNDNISLIRTQYSNFCLFSNGAKVSIDAFIQDSASYFKELGAHVLCNNEDCFYGNSLTATIAHKPDDITRGGTYAQTAEEGRKSPRE